ncbi:hypothetical protein ACFL6G_05365 [candidate division KSB1 bacterium]
MPEEKEIKPEELLIALSYTQDVIVRLLIKKGYITEEELKETLKEMKEEYKDK